MEISVVLLAYRGASSPGAGFPRSVGSAAPSRGLMGPGTAWDPPVVNNAASGATWGGYRNRFARIVP